MNRHRHAAKTRRPSRKGTVRRWWLVLLGLGIVLLWQIRRRRAPEVTDLANPRAPRVQAALPELTPGEASRILGCGTDEVPALLDGQPATRECVEQLALEHYRWRKHVDDPDSYWVTLKQAAVILGVSTQRVKQLLESGEVPYVVHRDGVRLMRREQLVP